MYMYPARREPRIGLDVLTDAVRWLFLAAR